MLDRIKALLSQVPFSHKKVIARLFLVVEYDETPERSALEDVIEKAKEQGGVELAQYDHYAPSSESLL